MIRKEILDIPNWWEITCPINKFNETKDEFEERQRYIWAKSLEVLSPDILNEDECYQILNESFLEFAIRFNENYSHLLNKACFMLDLYLDEFFKESIDVDSEEKDSLF